MVRLEKNLLGLKSACLINFERSKNRKIVRGVGDFFYCGEGGVYVANIARAGSPR